MNLSDWMLKEARQFVIEHKDLFMKAIIAFADTLPEPTKENTIIPNTYPMIRIWDKLLEMEDNPGREPLFKALKKITVSEHEHDYYYKDRMQVWLELWMEEVLMGNWKPRSLGHPDSCWKVDPDKRGIGYEFLRDRYYHNNTGGN